MEAYSRRENVKFIGIPEKINSEDDMEQDLPSQQIENTKDVVYKFLEEHLQIENPNVTIEFQRIHRLGSYSKVFAIQRQRENNGTSPQVIKRQGLCYI